jgi:hypothetical protein
LLVALSANGFPRRSGKAEFFSNKKLRRTSATHVEMMAVGRATAHLEHRSADLARRHYIDAGLAYEPTLPPALPEATKLLGGPARENVV